MGISVSNSDNNYQVQLVREHKKLKRKHIIAQEFQKASSPYSQPEPIHQQQHPFPPSTFTSIRKLTQNNHSPPTESTNTAVQQQKEAEMSRLKMGQEGQKPPEKSSRGLCNHEPIYEQKQARQMENGKQNVLKPVENDFWKDLEQRDLIPKQSKPLKYNRQVKSLGESASLALTKGPNISLRTEPAKQPPPRLEKNDMNIEIRRVSFNQFDWTVPNEDDGQGTFKRKDLIPSKNLVLSNKFAERRGNINQKQNQQPDDRSRTNAKQLSNKKNNNPDQNVGLVLPFKFQSLGNSRVFQHP